MVTIKDVANKAGVSTATVSRIVNGDKTYKTTDETRERVWEAVKELNYIPNQLAKNLSYQKDKSRTRQSNYTIGCILCVTTEKYSDPYYMAILSGIEAKLSEEGLSINLLRSHRELEDKTILLNLLSENLSGLILMESLSDEMYSQIKANVGCIVGIDTNHDDIDNIRYDRLEAGEKAVAHLIEKGHKRIGFLGALSTGKYKEKRYKGYLNALAEAGIKEDPSIVKDTRWSRKECHRATLEILDSPNPPTALFAASDLMGMVALNAIYERGLRVPDDVSVIGVSNIEMSNYTNPPLSTIDVPKKEMGMVAAEMLLYRLKGNKSSPRTIILPTELIARESTK